jgi:hypothetical protein
MRDKRSSSVTSVVGRTHFDKDQLQPHQKEAIRAIRGHLDQLLLAASATGEGEWGGAAPGRRRPPAPWYERTDRPTQVISIFGERGQGKTATIFSLCRMLAEDRAQSPYLLVPILDPELLGHGVEIFTTIGHNLRLAITQEQDASTQPGAHGEFRALEEQLTSFIELSLGETNEGRALTAETAGTLEAYAKRIASRTARRLERMGEFAQWIDSFLAVSKRKLLVFPIDDVDINREHSEQILQAVRLYLCHPRVVVILTAELEMIRRTIRNRLLKELPEVFTGGQAEAPAKEEEEETASFSLFGGSHRAHLLSQEYEADDEYAQQFLQKVLPPAYRVHLRGLRADERPGVKFALPKDDPTGAATDSATMAEVSIEDILAQAPLLSGVVRGLTARPDRPPSFPQVRAELKALIEDPASPGKSGPPLLASLGRTYPAVFPPILRVLLNQMVTLRGLVQDYRAELGRKQACPPRSRGEWP